MGGVLVAGLVIFMVGAARWRLAYERPPAESLPLIHADRRRRAWIHRWMLVAMFVTSAGVAGVAAVGGGAVAAMAAVVYAVGAVCMIAMIAFRLTVVPWAAERTVSDGAPPNGYAALDAWAGTLYVAHMASAYAAFAVLGAALLESGLLPAWAGWVGVGLGVGCLAGFVATRFAGPFNPPFLAHLYTGIVGVALLVT